MSSISLEVIMLHWQTSMGVRVLRVLSEGSGIKGFAILNVNVRYRRRAGKAQVW